MIAHTWKNEGKAVFRVPVVKMLTAGKRKEQQTFVTFFMRAGRSARAGTAPLCEACNAGGDLRVFFPWTPSTGWHKRPSHVHLTHRTARIRAEIRHFNKIIPDRSTHEIFAPDLPISASFSGTFPVPRIRRQPGPRSPIPCPKIPGFPGGKVHNQSPSPPPPHAGMSKAFCRTRGREE